MLVGRLLAARADILRVAAALVVAVAAVNVVLARHASRTLDVAGAPGA